MNKTVVAAILLLSLLGAGCTSNSKWMGFYYPKSQRKSIFSSSPAFPDYEDCIRWTKEQKQNDDEESSTTECGKGCKYNEGWKSYICKEVYPME